MKRTPILLLIVLLGFSFWWLLKFGTHGLFDDGVWYGCISRNWALSGETNWWRLVISPAMDPNFNGHPPLAFWMEGLLFKIFGEAIWVEHLYGLIMAIFSALGIYAIWNKVYAHSSIFSFNETGLLPIVFWLMMPMVGWSYENNMLENTLSFFTIWAVFFLIPSANKNDLRWLSILAGGLFIFCATMTKGPVGLFPLAVIPLHALIFRRGRLLKILLQSLLPLIVLILCYAALFSISQNAVNFFRIYFELQILGSVVKGVQATSRLLLIERIILEPIIPLEICLLSWVWIKYKNYSTHPVRIKETLFFFCLFLLSSLPILISAKQMPWYVVPALPYASLAVAFVYAPVWQILYKPLNEWKAMKISITVAAFTVLCLMITNWGKIGRNKEMLSDVFEIVSVVPKHDTIGITNSIYTRWNLHGYLYRYGYVNIFTGIMDYKHRMILPDEQVTFDTTYLMRKNLRGYTLYYSK